VLGLLLLGVMAIVAVTGFLSHAAYQPDLHGNAIVDPGADLPLNFTWPTGPSWLYALTQGLHVNVGLVAIPLVLAKLWSVIPRLYVWPPVASPAQGIERLSLLLLVSSAVFELVTGVMNIQYWYAFGFNFVVAHYYGAIVFVASLAVHLAVKLPVAVRALRGRGVTLPGGLAPVEPAAPTISRRGFLAVVGGGSLALLLANVGETIGGPLRRVALLAPRREEIGPGPNDFPVNRTAAAAGITRAMTGAAYRLRLEGGPETMRLDREALLALPQHTARLPIACVEGWTTTQEWTGVRLADLARLAGVPAPRSAFVRSLQPAGVLSKASLDAGQVSDPDALLALRVNGADLSPDHGHPARIIVPALPGVHNTKWVASITFEA
jgi:DMSO/TMAO reductase YedYZ molybdopterin-dependent catalytic subunit